jgi:serine/threonine-protein kinase HipA
VTTPLRLLRLSLHVSGEPGRPREIGTLSQFGDIARVTFDEGYIRDPARPTLSLCYRGEGETETRGILGADRDARLVRHDRHLPVYFQNLLPEGPNRDRLARVRGCSPDDEFELLAAAGHDLMGALQVDLAPLDDATARAIRASYRALGMDVGATEPVAAPQDDATSLPGMVTKFSAIQDGRRYVVRRHGEAGSFILKLPSTQHPDLVANEMTGYRLCAALGLHCAEASVVSRADAELPEAVPFDEILAVRRFDRVEGGGRVHMEEFAQALQYPPRQKYGRDLQTDYAAMLRVIDRLSARPAPDVQEFVGRLVAFVLLGNVDGHLKNWALVYPDGVAPMLAPLYDPVCVTAFFEGHPPHVYAHNRAIDARLRAFGWSELEALLRGAGLLRVGRLLQRARALVRQAQADWPALLRHAPQSVARSVSERLRGGVALTR